MQGRDRENRTASFITLGCKVNQYETQVMRESMRRHGYEVVDMDENTDVFVINTCTVTGISDRKSRQMIRRVRSLNPNATIVVTGCYAERNPDEIRDMPGIDLVLSNSEKLSIGEYLNEKSPSDPHPFITEFDGQTRALVKIQDGCDSFCTYCIVPYVRGGTIRSRPIDSIIQEVKSLAKNGHREVVLTGIHLGAYGKDMADGAKLPNVLRAVHDVAGVERIRLSSIEPMDISDELINEMARLPKCAHHFHVSLQSGSDKILKLMRRGYTSSDFMKLIDRIKEIMPDVGLSTDVMVGFPGETEQDFEDTCNLINYVRFNRMHVFRYSPRSGTPAAKFPNKVQDSVASRRSQEARILGDKLAQEFRTKMLNKEESVLIEDSREGRDKLLSGFTSNYIRVLIPDAPDELIGRVTQVKLVNIEGDYMIGLVNFETTNLYPR